MIARALDGNLQLRAAWARVRQARSLVTQANSGKWPQLEFNGQAARSKTRFVLPDPLGEQSLSTNQFSLSVAAGYELDLWKRIGSRASATAHDALALRDDAEGIAISLAAEIAETWFDLRAQASQRAMVLEQLETNKLYLELMELRYAKGVASALDVHQQRQSVVATRSRLAGIDMALGLFRFKLAILVGQPPSEIQIEPAASLPPLPALPNTGVPADLLVRRPDVRAARRRAEAADYRVAAAVADRLPALRLGGSLSLQSQSLADLIATPLWSVFGSIFQPIFNGGRLAAEAERNRDVYDERLLAFGQTVLNAIVEIESALLQEKQQRVLIGDLEEQVAIAKDTLREAKSRYDGGLIDYLPVLTAIDVEQRAALGLVQAHRQLISYRVQLLRALGGTWTSALKAPVRGGKS